MILREIKNMYINNFTKIEYLGSTGTQWIDTDFRPDSMTTSFELDISFEGQLVYNGTGKAFIKTSVTESSTQNFSVNFGGNYEQSNTIFLWFGKSWIAGTESCTLGPVALTRDIFRYSQGTVSYNGKSVNVDNSLYPRVAGRRKGTMQILKDFNCYNARLYGVKIWDNSSLVRDFIPVRIGSTGYMYDKVSNQLFGNSGTGNFVLGPDVNIGGLQQIYQNKLIEGVDYETADWLKGDGVAYIKGIKYNLWTNKVELKIGKIYVTTTENNELVYTNSSGNNWAVQQNPTRTPQLICIFRESGSGLHILDVNSMLSQVTLSFYQNGGYAYCMYNGIEYKGKQIYRSSWDTDIIPDIYSYKMSYIREVLPDGSYRSNLVPCKLLRSIPRNLDAQCKERVAGECGMIDLISGKFYGNVASSGTFTVENDNE